MIFLGSKFCPHCGAKVERTEASDPTPKPCPCCKAALAAARIGETKVNECPRCEGLWIDTETFNEICVDRDKQAAVVGGTPAPASTNEADFDPARIRYRPCPVCSALMNRVNFAHGSGVILDICKADGVWFDRDELRRIVEFIRVGGLETSRAIDREQWEAERRRRSNSVSSAPASMDVDLSPDSVFHDPLNAGSVLTEIIRAIGWFLFR